MLTQENRRKYRIRNKVVSSNKSGRPRIVVGKSNQHIHAQLIDAEGKVLGSFSTLNFDEKQKKEKLTGIKKAELVGKGFAEVCLKNGQKDVVFDRGQYAYQGRIKALAESCRKSGLNF